MREEYARIEITITKFDVEDVITTSGASGGTESDYTPGPVNQDYLPVI